MKKESLREKNEHIANLYAAKIMRVCSLFAAIVLFFNVIGIFIIPMTTMVVACCSGMFFMLAPTYIVNIRKINEPWVKYVVVSCCCLFILTSSATLNYHVTLLYILPMAIASMYFSPKLNVFALIFTVIVATLGQIVPEFLQTVCDDNYLNLKELFIYGIVPKAMLLLFLGYMFIALAKSTNQMMGSLIDAEEQEKLFTQMKKLTEKAMEVSKGLLQSITTLTAATHRTKQMNHEIAAQAEVVVEGIEGSMMQLNTAEESSSKIYGNLKDVVAESEEIAKLFVNVESLSEENKGMMQSVTEGMNQVKESTEICQNAMVQLEQKTKKIDGIVGIITDISDQTDLLALNAAIESARAGEYGKGFAVVTEEIRKLSQQTQRTLEDIKVILAEVLQQNEIAVGAMNQSADMQEKQRNMIVKAEKSAGDVTSAAKEMTEKMHSITGNTKHIESSTGHIAKIINALSVTLRENQDALNTVSASLDSSQVSMEELENIVIRMNEMADELAEVVNAK